MRSKTRPAFWRAYGLLVPSVKTRAREVYRLFAQNPDHPFLRFKKLHGREDGLVGAHQRSIPHGGRVRGRDTIDWIWIGTHNEFDILFT